MTKFLLSWLIGAIVHTFAIIYAFDVNILTGETPPPTQWRITINGVTHNFDKDQNYIRTEK